MCTKKEYKAKCLETNKEVIYGEQIIKNALNMEAKEFSCSNSEKCSKFDCICKDGNVEYKIKRLIG